MKCGEKGFVGVNGQPCGQVIGTRAKGCIWHTRTPEERKLLALKGQIVGRMKRALPASYEVPEFDSPEKIIAFARELVRLALTADVDPRRLTEARGGAALALSGFAAVTQARLVEVMTKLEGGGAALMLWSRLQEGLASGPRRPIPGRLLAPESVPEPAE